jgi:outer membrane receptor protein involved in Fe transport
MRFRYPSHAAFLAGSALGILTQPAWAQDVQQNADQPEIAPAGDDEAGPEDEGIVVTGTRIRGAKIAGEVITVGREAIVAAGQVDLGEAIRSLPQNFGGGQNPGVGFGAGLANSNVNSASSPNLRGLGPDATLTLLNGHRLPYDSAFGGVDISAIPLAALDRIEVVPDGASALYGSDAVAGVVNVILRRDMEGVTTSGQLGASTDGGYFRQQADIVGGHRWDGGGFLLAYDFARNSRIAARQRSYAATLDPETSLYPSQHRHAVTLSGHQALGSGIEAALDALYSRRVSRTAGGTAENRYLAEPEVETYTLAPSLKLALSRRWEGRVLGVFGRDRTHYRTTFSPLGGVPGVTSGCFCNTVASAEIGAEGPLFALPGGSARLAIGGGFRNNGLEYSRLVDGGAPESFDITRRSRYAYGELHLPLVSPETDLPGLHRLDVSAALRYEDYPGLDRLATPRIGVNYSPAGGLTLRGSWSRSFKAPTLYQQFVSYQAYLLPGAAFGAGSGTVMYTSGGNPELEPERARSWTAGFEFRPIATSDLTASATWFDIRYTDRVVQPIAGSIAAAFTDPGYAALIDYAPLADDLQAIVDGAQFGLQNFTGGPYNPADVIAFVDNRNVNVAAQALEGVDANVSWSRDLPRGARLGLNLAGTWLNSSQQLTDALPTVELAGTVFNPPELRVRGSATFESGALRVTSTVNYIGALVDRRFATQSRIPASATVDLGVSYDAIRSSGRDPGLSLSLTVQNLFDNRPEIIGITGPTDTPYDSTNYSPIGRFVAFGIRRHW